MFVLPVGSSQVQLLFDGLQLSSQQTAVFLSSQAALGLYGYYNLAECSGPGCGDGGDGGYTYWSMTMQRYTLGGAMLSCSPPVVAFSFCLLTGSTPALNLSSLAGLLSFTSGIFSPSSVSFSPSTSHTVTAISGGLFTPVAASLTAAGGYNGNSNAFTLQPGSQQAELGSGGLSLNDADRPQRVRQLCAVHGLVTVRSVQRTAGPAVHRGQAGHRLQPGRRCVQERQQQQQ